MDEGDSPDIELGEIPTPETSLEIWPDNMKGMDPEVEIEAEVESEQDVNGMDIEEDSFTPLLECPILPSIISKSTSTNTTSLTRRRHQYPHNNTHTHSHHHSQIKQPVNSIVNILPDNILQEICEHIDQYDLVNLSLTCKQMYGISITRLYRRITVILNGEFPIRYKGDAKQFVRDNGIKYMNSSIILNIENLLKLFGILNLNASLIQKVKFFIFDKCYINTIIDINHIQFKVIEFFGKSSHEINFLHITFIDFLTGILKLTKFLKNENIRSKIFKLFITNTTDLFEPVIPQSLTNLFLMLNEFEFIKDDYTFDLSTYPYDIFYSLFTLTCSTNKQLGLEILNEIKLIDPAIKLKLKGLTIFHFHKENLTNPEHDQDETLHTLNEMYNHIREGLEIDNAIENDIPRIEDLSSQPKLHDLDDEHNEIVIEYLKSIDKRLHFHSIESKVDLINLQHLYLKIDCVEHRLNNCKCFETFFKDFSNFSSLNGGLPNLNSFEIESFPNLEWLRPHQMLEDILTPLGSFIRTLNGLNRLTIDFSTPGYKMFDNSIGLSTHLLNKLNERLIEAFFLCFFDNETEDGANKNVLANLKQLYLQDFLTSFIYYKPDFYENLLHTCQCWGCQILLEKLKDLFYPIDSFEGFPTVQNPMSSSLDIESTLYMVIGYILGKLQADREVCIPIKESTVHYNSYPVYKGQPHTLHNAFHTNKYDGDSLCGCEESMDGDVNGLRSTNIDNLVTIYIIHQLNPIVEYLQSIFLNLNNLMIHGIYYEFNKDVGKLLPIYDDYEYPTEFLEVKRHEIDHNIKPDVKFGYFKNRK